MSGPAASRLPSGRYFPQERAARKTTEKPGACVFGFFCYDSATFAAFSYGARFTFFSDATLEFTDFAAALLNFFESSHDLCPDPAGTWRRKGNTWGPAGQLLILVFDGRPVPSPNDRGFQSLSRGACAGIPDQISSEVRQLVPGRCLAAGSPSRGRGTDRPIKTTTTPRWGGGGRRNSSRTAVRFFSKRRSESISTLQEGGYIRCADRVVLYPFAALGRATQAAFVFRAESGRGTWGRSTDPSMMVGLLSESRRAKGEPCRLLPGD